MKNSTGTSVILRCVFFWGLFQIIILVVAPIAAMFPNEWKNVMHGVFGTVSALLICWICLKHEKNQ
jgi:hypothetical protein